MVAIGLWFAAALPILAADTGADIPRVPPSPAQALIPQPAPRFAERGDQVNLKEAKDGTLTYEATGFTAKIAADGTVAFTERRVFGLSVVPWMPSRAPLAVPSLQGSLVNLLKGKAPPPAPPMDDRLPPPNTTALIPDVSRYRPDTREDCEMCQEPYTPAIFSAFGRGDVADELDRFSGQDPNRYQKAAFLAATHDRRIDMAVKAHARDVRRANAALPGRLQFIACDDRLSYRDRRAILVALGREMDPTSPDGANAATAISDFVKLYDAGIVVCGNPR